MISAAEARLRELEEAALAGGDGVVVAHDALEVTAHGKTWQYWLRSDLERVLFGISVRDGGSLTRSEALDWLAKRLAYNARLKAEMAPIVAAADAVGTLGADITDDDMRRAVQRMDALMQANRRKAP